MNKRMPLKLGVDVIEKYAWGIDLYTYRNILDLLPNNFNEVIKSDFIENCLICELSNMVFI